MTNPDQERNDYRKSEANELVIRIPLGFPKRMLMIPAFLVCLYGVLELGLVVAKVFAERTYPVDTCPDYPNCSEE
jgi:hypothetical protein